jgi:hypothetical protein
MNRARRTKLQTFELQSQQDREKDMRALLLIASALLTFGW